MNARQRFGLFLLWFVLMQSVLRGDKFMLIDWFFVVAWSCVGAWCFLTSRAVDASPTQSVESESNNGSRN